MNQTIYTVFWTLAALAVIIVVLRLKKMWEEQEKIKETVEKLKEK